MMQIRKATARGLSQLGWLDSRHTFSFAQYYDPNYMGFSDLRVINEDRIIGGGGFPTHAHQDMEIISYVIDGALEHKDSMGNTTVIVPSEVQRMSAGTGVKHSEYNQLQDKRTHFLQIWILPEQLGIQPSYGQKSFANAFENNNLVLAVSKNGRDSSISMNQDADIYLGKFREKDSKIFHIRHGRHVWVQMIAGEVVVNGNNIETGDGIAIQEEKSITIIAVKNSEFILLDLR